MGDLCFLVFLAGLGWVAYTVGSAVLGVGVAVADAIPKVADQTASTVAEVVIEETATDALDALWDYFFRN